jgi:ABC-2 type transport system permease protein
VNRQRLASVMRKEIAQIFRDRRSLGTILSLPIIQLVLYGYLSNEVLFQPTIVWDQSNSAESRELVRAFENTRYFRVVYRAGGLREIEGRIDAGQAKIGIVVPPNYAARVRSAAPVRVLVIVDASDATSARVVLSVASGVGQSLSQRIAVESIERRGQRAPPAPAVDVRTRAWYNPNLQSTVFIVPGVLAVILQFSTTFLSVTTIVREREMGTLEQLVVTPIQPSELMLGKILPLVAIGYVNITLILGLAWLMFGVAVRGSLLMLYVLTLAFFFSTLGIGTLISTASKNLQQALQLSQIVLLPSILISGFLFPRESLPPVLQAIGLALPLTHYVTIVRGILIKGVGWEFLWRQIVPLVGLGLVVFSLAIVRFQKKID